MTPSQACVDLIKRSESCRLTAYQDPGGVWTVGWGTTFPGLDAGFTWTQEQADNALLGAINVAGQMVSSLVEVPLTQGQFDALVDFTYNMGAGRLQSSTLLRLLNAGNYAVVPYELYHTDSAGQPQGWVFQDHKPLPGLIARRQAEIALWNTPDAAATP